MPVSPFQFGYTTEILHVFLVSQQLSHLKLLQLITHRTEIYSNKYNRRHLTEKHCTAYQLFE